MITTGQKVGSYTVLRQIGIGGMGTVYEAQDHRIKRRVALKVLHSPYAQHPQVVQRMYTEAQAVNRIAHAGVVQIWDLANLPDGTPYLVMELLEGESLRQRVLPGRGPMSLGTALRLAQEVAQVMATVHEHGVVHRDLKPDNVMVVPDPQHHSGERVKILDFGIAKVAVETWELTGGPQLTQDGHMMGTPTYVAPEQIQNAAGATAKVDVYSLGTILYEMLAGRPPFRADNAAGLLLMQMQSQPPPLRRAAPQVPEAVAALVHRMLDKRPEGRPSMKQVDKGLADLLVAMNGADTTVDGELLVGSFVLLRELGPGEYGAVYEAEHADDRTRRAWVVLPQPEYHEPLWQMAQRLVNARDPGIVRIYDMLRPVRGSTVGCAIVLEALSGQTLRAYWEQGQHIGRHISVRHAWEERRSAEALVLSRQLAAAVLCAQDEGVSPRDLRMEHLWVVRDRRGEAHVKVFDFGAAQAVAKHEAPPLQQGGPRAEPDEPATVHELGALVVEMLIGTRPAAAEPVGSKGSGAIAGVGKAGELQEHSGRRRAVYGPLPAGVPREVAQLLRRMLDRDPARRPTLAQVLAELDRAGGLHGGARRAAWAAGAMGVTAGLCMVAWALKLGPWAGEQGSSGTGPAPSTNLEVAAKSVQQPAGGPVSPPEPAPGPVKVPRSRGSHTHRDHDAGRTPPEPTKQTVPAAPPAPTVQAAEPPTEITQAEPAQVPAKVVLTVNVSGPGAVEIPGQKPCAAGACRLELAPGAHVLLKAHPADGSFVSRWQGSSTCAKAPAGPTCNVGVDYDRQITVEFDRLRQLTVKWGGSGKVWPKVPSEPCAVKMPWTYCVRPGTEFEFKAEPGDGWRFQGWSGCIATSPNACRGKVEGDVTVAARFEEIQEPDRPVAPVIDINHNYANPSASQGPPR